MPKNKRVENHDELGLSAEMMPNDEFIAGMMDGMIQASNHQQVVAIELTRLVLQKSAENVDEKYIFSVFERATKLVVDNIPLKELWDKFS
jgi:hypothetical protein